MVNWVTNEVKRFELAMSQPLRIFIAVTLPTNVRDVLQETIEALKSYGISGVRWTSKEHIHLTVKFLGNVKKWVLPSVLHRLNEVVLDTGPFHLKLEHLHTFPKGKSARIVWTGIDGNLDALLFLQDSIQEEMVNLGFRKDSRNSLPHITLGRVNYNGTAKQRECIRRGVDILKIPGKAYWEVESIDVMESKLFHSGAAYYKLAQIRLGSLLKKSELA